MKLDFIIIGAQKAATTFVQRGLIDHPEVVIPEGESDFLLYENRPDKVEKLLRYLLGEYDVKTVKAGLKGADYLGHSDKAESICEQFPGVKIIAITRDPMERAISAYHHLIRYGLLPLEHPETGLAKIYSGEWDNLYPHAKEIREYGLYGMHLERWSKACGNSHLLVLEQEQIRQYSDEALRTVYEFLGVSTEHQTQNLHRRSQAVTYDLRRLRWLSLPGKLRRKMEWRGENGKMTVGGWEPLIKCLWKSMTAVDRLLLARVFGNNKSKLSTSLCEQIRGYYDTDQKSLDNLRDRTNMKAFIPKY